MEATTRLTDISIRSALLVARAKLASLPDANPTLDADVLLAFVLKSDRTRLYTWSDRLLTLAEVAAFNELIKRRIAGLPIAYLVGEREFWSMRLRVTSDTLIPRPDTETLVEHALELLPEHKPLMVLDLGTGCGAIALALGRERPQARILATDRSFAALRVAQENAASLGVDKITFFAGNWLRPVNERAKFDLIVSNPPYVAESDPHLDRGDVVHEPRSALTAGPDGLSDLCQIIDAAPQHLKAGGWLLVEHGSDQGAGVRTQLRKAGFGHVGTRKDMGERDRSSSGNLLSYKIP